MLGDIVIHSLQGIPPQLAVFLIAMLPSLELSVAVPAGLGFWHLPWWQVYILGVCGSLVPGVVIFLFFERIALFLRQRSQLFERFFNWLFERTRKNFYKKHEKWGDFALFFLVAIPLPIPLSGVWSGSLAAWLFGIPFKKAFPIILVGVMIAGAIATSISLGVIQLF